MTIGTDELARAAERYMKAVQAVFAIDPKTKKCFAEGSPTKDQETYERFLDLNDTGKLLDEAIARTRTASSREA